jgi:homoserine kinase
MTERTVLIRVPASVGNFGGATGCAALAIDAALNVRASARRDGSVHVRYFGENGQRVPRDASSLAVRALQSALEFAGRPFLGIELEMYGSVPVGVGLGSSTAAVWAGLLTADRLYRLGLGEKVLFDLAAAFEGRADNLRAAWLGGFVASFEEDGSTVYRSTVVPDDLMLSIVIPEIGSVQSREPGGLSLSARDRSACLKRAEKLSGFIAHMDSEESSGLGEAFVGLAEKTVPGLDEALRLQAPGVQALFVCGSGPSVGIVAPAATAESVAKSVLDCFAWHGVSSTLARYRATNSGARDWNAAGTEIRLAPPVGLDMPGVRPLPV